MGTPESAAAKSGWGSFFKSLFSRPEKSSSNKRESKKKKSAKSKKEPSSVTQDKSSPVDIPIEETETLKHFQKPRPPTNRRRPKSSAKLLKSNSFEVSSEAEKEAAVEVPETRTKTMVLPPLPTTKILPKIPENPAVVDKPVPPSQQDKPKSVQREADKNGTEAMSKQSKSLSKSVPDLVSSDEADVAKAKGKKNRQANSIFSVFQRGLSKKQRKKADRVTLKATCSEDGEVIPDKKEEENEAEAEAELRHDPHPPRPSKPSSRSESLNMYPSYQEFIRSTRKSLPAEMH